MITLPYYNQPDANGKFGQFGGRFVPETLFPFILQLEEQYFALRGDNQFWSEYKNYLTHYVGRPSPLYYAQNLTKKLGGAKIYLKRDELNHTGAHKINNAIGQALVAKKMKKSKIIAETGAGQHGVATATVCALFGMECKIFMGAKDIERQQPNVTRMKLLGAEVVSVNVGKATLNEAMNEAIRYWTNNAVDTYYLIGTAAGPHPYPTMVRDFQSIIGIEAKEQIMELEQKLPDMLIASIGGGSNAIGLFYPFIDDKSVEMIGIEAGGIGTKLGENSASIKYGKIGVLHGNMSMYLQSKEGQIANSHSIAAGLDYPGIGPEHSYLNSVGRVKYETITDSQAMNAIKELAKTEGIIPAIEPAHSIAYLLQNAGSMPKNSIVIANLCGRGDKDLQSITSYFNNAK